MTLNRIAVACLSLVLGVMGPGAAMAWSAPLGTLGAGFGQDRGGWDAAPREMRGIERQGFMDGIEGARKDFGNQRQANVNNREEYRHPGLPRGQWDAYQRGFRRGYEQGAAHLWGGGGGPAMGRQRMEGPGMGRPGSDGPDRGDRRGPDRDMRGMDQGPGREARQQGFQDGVAGALKDYGNHRQPDVDNREEYRRPNVPYEVLEPYRDGFRRGYQAAARELMSGGGRGMAAGPGGEARVRGFQDGMQGALRDFGNHRQPDVDNREEYRNPNLPYQLREPYRDGFRRGYNVGMAQLMGMPGGR